MAYAWQDQSAQVVGNRDGSLSPFLKVWVKQGGVCVVGAIGEGTSKELQTNWLSPFEEDSAGSKFSKTGGIIQQHGGDAAGVVIGGAVGALGGSDEYANRMGQKAQDGVNGLTSYSTLNSEQVWKGNQPHNLTINLRFYALEDAMSEVMEPLKALEMMMAPEVNAIVPGGRIPDKVFVNIGRNVIYGPCIIQSMSHPLDKERDKNGYLVRADVNLNIQTHAMLNRSQIPSTYG